MIIILIFVSLLFFIFGIHISYPFLLKWLSRKTASLISSSPMDNSHVEGMEMELPFVSIIIPVHNEESVIERRLNNIFESNFPKNKMELIVVDSGSIDNTRSIIEEKFPNRVTLLKEELRKGKANAINLALQICKGEIVIITDGPALYHKDTILQLVCSLKIPSVGGATTLYSIPNASENQITSSEYTFWSHKDKIRILESRVYSTSWVSGEACAFKKSIVSKIDEDSLADDSNIALQLLSKGYRVVINENSHFTEKSPSEVFDYFKIKIRRSLGGLMETLRFRFFLFKREYGYFGVVIFPYRFFAQVVSPIASFLAMFLLIPALLEIAKYFGIYSLLIIGLSVLYLGFHFRCKIIVYVIFEIIGAIALLQLLTRRRDVKWKQSRTTRI